MTACDPQDFAYEPAPESELDARRGYWRCAEGLQAIDGLTTSAYLHKVAAEHCSGNCTTEQAGDTLRAYYRERERTKQAAEDVDAHREADLVSMRIVELLERKTFMLAPSFPAFIHRRLFQDLDEQVYCPGVYKREAFVKSELILNGDSVLYADPALVENSLNYLFNLEFGHVYPAQLAGEPLKHFAQLIAHLWQIHPFVEGNTRTVAVFAALYLNQLGFDINNEPFEKHSRYFRNALVRANYRNAQAGIMPDLGCLTRFFENLLLGAHHELRSRELMCQALYDDPTLLRNVPQSWAIEQ